MASTLVILRYGQSTWNHENLFTGWHDVPLSARGSRRPAPPEHWPRPGVLDVVHTSLLTRAIQTAERALRRAGGPGSRCGAPGD